MKFLTLFTILLISSASFAQEDSSNPYAPKQGRLRITAGGGIGYSSIGGLIVQLAFQAEKFIFDKVAIGGYVSYDNNYLDFEKYELGPTLTYQFWTHKKFRAFVGQQILASHYVGGSSLIANDKNDIQSITLAGLGWKFLELYAFHRELLDKSDVELSGSGGGLRLSFFF